MIHVKLADIIKDGDTVYCQNTDSKIAGWRNMICHSTEDVCS